jgi:uncharacterized protein with HEPN domain
LQTSSLCEDDRIYLNHILEAIRDVQEYSSTGRDAFMGDKMRQDAVIRKLEIIGEAVKNLSDTSKQRRAEIPWRRIAGMRDRLTHDYFGVDLALVWMAVERDPESQGRNRGLVVEGGRHLTPVDRQPHQLEELAGADDLTSVRGPV